jgi:hypothetical protein
MCGENRSPIHFVAKKRTLGWHPPLGAPASWGRATLAAMDSIRRVVDSVV